MKKQNTRTLIKILPARDDIVVNDRWGNETRGKHGGYYTTEYDIVDTGVITEAPAHPWEECQGMGSSFGYRRLASDEWRGHLWNQKLGKGRSGQIALSVKVNGITEPDCIMAGIRSLTNLS